MEDNETVNGAEVSAPPTDDSLLSSPDGDSGTPRVEGDAHGVDDAGNLEIAAGGDMPADPAASQAAAENKPANDDDGGEKTPQDSGKTPQQSFEELRTIAESEKAARIAAEAKIALLEKSPVAAHDDTTFEIPVGENGEPLFKDITKMSVAEVREWQEDDPVGFQKNQEEMTLFKLSVRAQQGEREQIRRATVTEISKTFDDYAKENPDFNEMWDKGELQTYMQKHPGHNAISAHMALTQDKRITAAADKAAAKAAKEAEDRVIKNFQAKKNATVITPGSVTRTTGEDGVDPALKNTKQYGGIHAVLANKLAESRRMAAGRG